MKDRISHSQVVTTFGPGAMIDLPTQSVMIAGLGHWRYAEDEKTKALVHEPRLLARLAERFGTPNLTLRRPPRALEDPTAYESSVGAWRFPRWFVVNMDRRTEAGHVERRLVHRNETSNGRFHLDGRHVPLIPIRFVRACPRGHIDDIEWTIAIHGGPSDCLRPKWIMERGNAGDLDEIVARCECGKSVRMSEIADRRRDVLGMCDGNRPWLGTKSREKCGVPSQLLIRTASNAYFPERQTVISIPASIGGVDERVNRLRSKLDALAEDREGLKVIRKFEPERSILEGLSDAQVWESYDRLKSGVAKVSRSVKDEEFEALTQVAEEIGADTPEGHFFARTLPKDQWQADWMKPIRRVVLVHRLRAVSALLGFTRFEASSADIHGELDQEVRSASLDRQITWLPAIETHGEGIFLEFDPAHVMDWLRRPGVDRRMDALKAGYDAWKKEHEDAHRDFAGLPYIMLHSLSHLLQTAISLECGYSASSLQERIYALQGKDGPGRFGILIYTAATDAQGTLGGLVEAGRSIRSHLRRALETAMLCSNDPVCSQHAPDAPGTAHLNGAACHGCLLVPETSCEQRNDFLDRALVVPTVESPDAAFFPELT